MAPVARILALTVLLWPSTAAAECNASVSCIARQDEQDETSLVQVKKSLMHGTHRAETHKPSLEDLALEEGRKLAELIKNDSPEQAIELGAGSAEVEQFPAVMIPARSRRYEPRIVTNGIQLPGMMVGSGALQTGLMPGMPPPAMVPPMGLQVPEIDVVPGLAPPIPQAIPSQFGSTSTIATQMSPAPESPEKAARRAAENEAIAERAMENSVHKAQDEERAAMYAAKKAAALRAAAERAAAAESAAAQSEMLAADSFQNEAVRRAEAQRTHAQASAVKAVVQKAAAYQASAEQQSAAKRAAAARTAAESARTGLQHDAEERYRLGCGRRRCKMDDRFGMTNFGNGMLDPQEVRRHEDEQLDDLDEQEDSAVDEGHHQFHHEHAPWSGSGDDHTQVYCNSFECISPWSLRLHPEAIQCGPGACIRETCCLGPPGGAPPVLGPGSFPPPGAVPPVAVPGGPPPLSPSGVPEVPIGPPPGVAGPGIPPIGAFPVGPTGLAGVAPLQPAFSCHVGDAVTATWAGDNGQYRGEIQSINADNTISVSWLDGDSTYPQVAAAQVFKDGVSCVSMPGGNIGPVSQGGITIMSDGTQARPHCSWRTTCNWDAPTQGMCARSLCQASGYPGGSYVSASNDMCTSSYTSDPFHYFEADSSRFLMSNGGEGNEAMITASCDRMGGSAVPVAVPPVLPVSNRVLPMAR